MLEIKKLYTKDYNKFNENFQLNITIKFKKPNTIILYFHQEIDILSILCLYCYIN